MQDLSDNFILYNGKKYFFNVQIYSDLSEELNHGLRNGNVIQFEYSNEFNKIYLEGSLIYQDNLGIIDKYLEKSIVYVQIIFAEMIQQFDNEITIEKQSDTHRFIHKFIVNGIKIVSRENHVITYKLSLISVNWIKCCKTINFSNYNEGPQSIFKIIKSMLNINELDINTESFDQVECPAEINYITNGNDNSITSIKYLLGKLYYYPSKDTCLKFLTYNETEDLFYIINITDETTLFGNSNILASFFKSTLEDLIYEDTIDLNSVTKFSKNNVFYNFRAKTMFDFNYNKNQFIDESIPSKNIINFQNEHFNTDTYENKYDFFENDEKFVSRGSYWNNDFNIYNSSVKTLLEDSAIVINTNGEILRKPGYFVNLNVDRDTKYLEDESLDKQDEIKNKYKAFEGSWVVAKTRNIIIPSLLQSQKHMFRQNLVLVRNYIKKDK